MCSPRCFFAYFVHYYLLLFIVFGYISRIAVTTTSAISAVPTLSAGGAIGTSYASSTTLFRFHDIRYRPTHNECYNGNGNNI